MIKLALLLLAQIVGIFDNYRGLIKLALLLLAQIAGIFDNPRIFTALLLLLVRLTCSQATRSRLSQIAGIYDSQRIEWKNLTTVIVIHSLSLPM
ncbi:MAG: hypothetical protein F6K56_29930 [Moorea sp. SIO3G5]|nr:hypothetical protein [Moorena sp. SIO3G5]